MNLVKHKITNYECFMRDELANLNLAPMKCKVTSSDTVTEIVQINILIKVNIYICIKSYKPFK